VLLCNKSSSKRPAKVFLAGRFRPADDFQTSFMHGWAALRRPLARIFSSFCKV
jgi:hypothetical protein